MSASPTRVPILMYHEVAAHPPAGFERWAVSPRAFALQMRWLALNRYTPIALDALLAWRAGAAPLPRRPIVITFDDGYRGVYEHALPVLRRHSFTATIYLVAGLMGERAAWLEDAAWRRLPLMSWEQAREAERHGITLGAHTVSHPTLATLAPDAVRRELAGSRERLEDALGHAVCHLAYPYGSYCPSVRTVAQEAGFQSACTTVRAFARASCHPLELPRLEIKGTDSSLDFVSRLRTSEPFRAALRSRARRLARFVR